MGNPISWRFCSALALIIWLVGGMGLTLAKASEEAADKKAFMVNEYLYEPPEGTAVNLDIGLSLCGTRCHALSENFASYIKPGGWRLIKIAGNVTRRVELNNPFLGGQCVCVGDEYKIDWYDAATYQDRTEGQNPEAN